MNKYLFETLLSVLWVISLEVDLLDQMAILYSIFFEEPPYCFRQWLHHFTLSPAEHQGSSVSTSLLFSVFLIVAILMGVRF